MKKLSILLITVFFSSLLLTAESRVALVIGNSNYSGDGYLSNPQNDATAIAEKLKKLGFKVIPVINGNVKSMNSAVNSFRDSIAKDCDIAFFFYSGHGVQVNGKNYLIPLEESFEDEDDVESYAINMSVVLDKMKLANNKILILDACRNNPFLKKSHKSLENSKGLAAIKTDNGDDNIAIIYATLPGEVAENGDGKYSPFTESLLNHIEKQVIIAELFSYVNVDVANKTKKRQKPRSEYGGEASMIRLAGKPESISPIITNNTTKVETPTVEYKDSDLIRREQNGKWGFVDKTGKVVIPFKYDYVSMYGFREGLAAVELNKKLGFIDKTDKVVIPFKYDSYTYGFREGLVGVKLNNKFGFIDKTDKMVIPFKYDFAYGFSEGLAAVELNKKWGSIDKTDKVIIPIKYDEVGFFGEGLVRVKLNNKCGFVDKTDKIIIPFKYDAALQFNEGLAPIILNKKWGFIDKTGREVIPIKYDYADWFYNGQAKVKLDGREFYIDKNGNEVK